MALQRKNFPSSSSQLTDNSSIKQQLKSTKASNGAEERKTSTHHKMDLLHNSEPTRNALNQRASRARRRTYILDLERKVRDHERQGVQATAQVQAAARAVADENRALREEVRVLRERNAALEETLRALWRREEDVETGRRRQKQKQRRRRNPERELEEMAEDGDRIEVLTDPAASAARTLSASMAAPTTSIQPPPPNVNTMPAPDLSSAALEAKEADREDPRPHPQTQSESPLATSPSLTSRSSSPSSPRSPAPTSISISHPNTTSCAQAAIIIASMRGLPSGDSTIIETEILPALGCGVGISPRATSKVFCPATVEDLNHCAVDNAQLFGILDREGNSVRML